MYDYAVDVAKVHDIMLELPTQRRRKRKRPSQLEESVILETVGSHDNVSTSEELRCHFYLPVLDKFISELSRRFDDNNLLIMNGVSASTPSSSVFLSLSKLKDFAEAYGIVWRLSVAF